GPALRRHGTRRRRLGGSPRDRLGLAGDGPLRHAPGLRCAHEFNHQGRGPRSGPDPRELPGARQRRPRLTAPHPVPCGREPPAGRPHPVHGCRLRPQHRHDRNRVVEASMRFPARPATIPPQLPEWDPAWSRIVEAQSSDGTHAFHVLDTLPTLRAAGLEPEGTIVALHGNPTWSYLWRRLARETVDAARSGGRVWRLIAPDQLEMGFSERLAHE